MIGMFIALMAGILPLAAPHAAPRVPFPGNVVCSDFNKVDGGAWNLRKAKTLDLGNWAGTFVVSGRVTPGRFVAHGHDLFDVLERTCEIAAFALQTEPDARPGTHGSESPSA